MSDDIASLLRMKDDPNIYYLFDHERIQEWPKYQKAILHFPVSLLLLLVRATAAIFGFSVLSWLPRTSSIRNVILKGLCRVLGLVIEVDAKHIDDGAKILVANHLSFWDRLVVNTMVPCSTINGNFKVSTVNSLAFMDDEDFRFCSDLTDNQIRYLQNSIESSPLPLLHFPECASTNGKVGLLRFSPGVFSLNAAVQPVLIQVSLSSSFMKVSPSLLGSSVWADVFWSLILPSTHYNLRTLPSMVKLPNELPVDFSKRVRKAMASALNIRATIFCSSDKKEYIKRIQTPSHSVPTSSYTSRPSNRMTMQPLFLPRPQDLPKNSQQSTLTMNTAAETFGKSPKERMASYHKRKTMLLEAAREKYLEKHYP